MNDHLDPDHWVNGGEHDSMLPIEKAFIEMEQKIINAEAEIERLRKHRDVLAREVGELRLKHQSVKFIIEQLMNEIAALKGTK